MAEDMERLSPEEIDAVKSKVKKMLMVGGVFVAIGFLLNLGALFLELTQFHPTLEEFFSQFTQHSLAGGGPDRAGNAALNTALSSIHKYPSTLLWMKLGGIANILVGIFFALAAIVKTLSLMPHRLGYEMQKTQG
jgi:hypothetical protein